jgi:DNA-binding transcriptional MocR family regulator
MQRIAYTKGLDPFERAVLSGLALDGDWKTGERCSPALEWLAEYSGLSRTSVCKTLQGLKHKGWISSRRRQRAPTVYKIILNRLETRPAKRAKVPDFLESATETLEPSSEEILKSATRTIESLTSATRTIETGLTSATRTPEPVLKSVLRTPFPSTYVPNKVQDPYLQDRPDQEPALRAISPPDESSNDENPEAKAKLDAPAVDFAAMRARLSSQPPRAPSHRQRVAARRAAHA